MRQLDVYFNDTKAGVLTEYAPGKGYSFVYEEAYLLSDLPSISVNLIKRREAYESESLFPFFTNMLPEGTNRQVICRSHKIDDQDFFGLLSVMAGKDFIGAVNIRNIADDGYKEETL